MAFELKMARTIMSSENRIHDYLTAKTNMPGDLEEVELILRALLTLS